eukprot:m.83384 g.83384  ORF g.83384 m.83384 type:complete len:197 (+) comp36342_c0_seq5:34-624(+)
MSRKEKSAFKWSLTEAPVKVDKWDGTKVKNALDDAAKKFLGNTGCVETHRVTDARLFICTVACSLSLLALIYDYLFPFPKSKPILTFCSVGYFILMGVLTLFVMVKEKNYVYWGVQKDQTGKTINNWAIRSTLKRFDHMFTLVLECRHGTSGKVFEAETTQSIGTWFDSNGILYESDFGQSVKKLHAEVLSQRKED